MSKNSAITAFFKPVPKVSSSQRSEPSLPQLPSQYQLPSESSSRPPPRAQTPQGLPSSPSSSPKLPLGYSLSSSPPAPPARPVRDPNTVIPASDDEDSDASLSSDDDLPDLFATIKAKDVAISRPAPSPRQGLCVTPRAKRTALEFPSSPLTIQTRRTHKFDMKALMEHAEADSAIAESEQRIQSMFAREAAEKAAAERALLGSAKKNQPTMHETMMNVFSDPSNSEAEARREKLFQAVKRTEVTVQRPRWRFYDHQDTNQSGGGLSIEARIPFPRTAATGIWSFLGPTETRSQFFEDGVVFTIQMKIRIQEKQQQTRLQALPDDIFLWLLREIHMEKSRKPRDEYIRLLGACDEQVGRLVDPNMIDQLFRYAGASERVFESPSKPTARLSEDRETAYAKRDKTPLRSILKAMTEASIGLSQPSRIRCVAILLRLGMDNLVREDQDLAQDFQETLYWLLWAAADESWDTFCFEVCSSLHTHIKEASLRCDAASSIPIRSARLVELRRRLALVCVFDDPSLARSSPDTTFSLGSIFSRLDAPDFQVNQDTDFFELGALAELLGFAIGDGSPPDDPGAAREFDADVDAVAHRIKKMWSSIQGRGAAYASRLDTRVTLQDLERKLQHATRTRPLPKTNIFDIKVSEYDEVERPKQQRFLQRFLQKGGE